MSGLKRNSHRRTDVLARTDWAQVERLLGDHYRTVGYAVDHVGTAGTGSRFDGGIDLKLRRDSEYVVVQCKHWNAMKVAHNDVHQLLGIMVNEGATGAILVTSGEFTRAAIEAATRHGHVLLVDGDDLREMLGPLPEPEPERTTGWEKFGHSDVGRRAKKVSGYAGGRLLSAAEDRVRGGMRTGGSGVVATAIKLALVKAVLGVALMVGAFLVAKQLVGNAVQALQQTATRPIAAVPQPVAPPQPAIVVEPTAPLAQLEDPREPTPAETRKRERDIAEQQRKAAEAIKILEATTPALYTGEGPRR